MSTCIAPSTVSRRWGLAYGLSEREIQQSVFEPLGLDEVVPNNTHLDEGLHSLPHGDALDPDNPSRFQSTGGWSVTAQNLARVMCGMDQTTKPAHS